MSRFRLFGRPPEPAPDAARPPAPRPHITGSQPIIAVHPAPGSPPPGVPAVAPPGWAAGPATRAARPAVRRYPGDPPTDPFGYPPVAGPAAGSRAGAAPGSSGPAPYPDRAEASALAGAFALDYLSWDEDDPARRGRVLREYLPAGAPDPARLGWSGRGRQRAELVLPGRVRPDGEGRVLVDVRVRVTPYRAVADRVPTPEPDPQPPVAGVPAAAPAPTGPGWRSLASHWVRLTVAVVLDGGRLLVDAWEELLGADQPPPPPAPHRRRPAGAPDDHALDGDELDREEPAEPVGVSR